MTLSISVKFHKKRDVCLLWQTSTAVQQRINYRHSSTRWSAYCLAWSQVVSKCGSQCCPPELRCVKHHSTPNDSNTQVVLIAAFLLRSRKIRTCKRRPCMLLEFDFQFNFACDQIAVESADHVVNERGIRNRSMVEWECQPIRRNLGHTPTVQGVEVIPAKVQLQQHNQLKCRAKVRRTDGNTSRKSKSASTNEEVATVANQETDANY